MFAFSLMLLSVYIDKAIYIKAYNERDPNSTLLNNHMKRRLGGFLPPPPGARESRMTLLKKHTLKNNI